MQLAEVRDRTDVQSLVRSEIERAADYIEGDLAYRREESLRYYRGEPFGNEEEGRSQVVWRVVRDAVRQIMPSLLRVFFGSERAVEYAPFGPEDTEQAEQATDYANYVVLQDNPGIHVFHDAFQDSLNQVNGVVKLFVQDKVEVTYHDFQNLDDAGVQLALQEPGTELTSVNSRFANPDAAGQMIAMGFDPPQVHDVRIKRTKKEPRIRLCAVPPEEFLIDPSARSVEDAVESGRLVGHKMYLTVAELVAMGYDREMVEDKVAADGANLDSVTARARAERHGGWGHDFGDTANPETRKVLYCEVTLRVDLDGPPDEGGDPSGDGIAELRKFCTLGDDYEVVNGDGLGEPVDDAYFTAFCPFPEPHEFFGEDVADQTKDLQKYISNLVRTASDSLAFSVFSRTVVDENVVRIADVLNTEIGAVIRTQGAPANSVMPLTHQQVAQAAMPFIEMGKAEADSRVGVHNMALEADALQSTTKSAVNAQVDAARQQLELIARLYAEIGMKRFYQLLLKLIVATQDKERMIRLRNKWVPINPSTWNANMDVVVNVGLGNGASEDRINALTNGMAFQMQMVRQMGPNNPVCSLGQLSNSAAKLYELAGWRDTSQFLNKLPLDFQLPPPPPQKSPEEVLAEVEIKKAQAHALETAAKIELDRDRLIADTLLKAVEMEGKYPGLKVDVSAIQGALNRDQMSETVAEGEVKPEPKPEPANALA